MNLTALRLKPIVAGTDGSDTAHRAVDVAVGLARALGAPLHLVSAYRPVPEHRLRAERVEVPEDIAWEINPREDADAMLRTVVEEIGADDLEIYTHALADDPAEALLQVAEHEEAQLIVVGNRGMNGSRRFLLGSVPDKVSHHAPCNVLIVRTTGPGA